MVERSILLADMDAFFASIEQKEHPEFKGKPVLVTGSPHTHSVVTAASYEARPYGVKSGMPLFLARKYCPRAIVIPGDQCKYLRYSKEFIKICQQFSDLVEYYSVDEAFIDVTHCTQLFGPPFEIAGKLKKQVKDKLGLICSVGIGPNKTLAKIAAKKNKPNGIGSLTVDEFKEKIWKLEVSEIPGIGSRLTKHLENLGILTIGQLARFPVSVLKQKFGVYGEIIHYLANGIDQSPVDPNIHSVVKSMGHSLSITLNTPEDVELMLLYLSDKVAERLRHEKLAGKTVTLVFRTPDFITFTRAKTLSTPTFSPQVIASCAFELYKKHFPEQKARLVGVSVSSLFPIPNSQISLFGGEIKLQRLFTAVDKVRNKYGDNSLTFGALLPMQKNGGLPQKVGVFLTKGQKAVT